MRTLQKSRRDWGFTLWGLASGFMISLAFDMGAGYWSDWKVPVLLLASGAAMVTGWTLISEVANADNGGKP